ncbi:MAG: DEAD/DEAH box helicase, partial [Candidatus Omnitrophica bacterium]|nr:DEAD/DEAH box helicase [Candidatus Omnitrophota bacterium]
ELVFDYSGTKDTKITMLEHLIGKSGTLTVSEISIEALEKEEYVIPVGFDNDGASLTEEQCFRLFSLPANVVEENCDVVPNPDFSRTLESRKMDIIEDIEQRNTRFFEDEMGKLDKWADDLKKALEAEIKELDKEIKQLKREAKRIPVLKDKLKVQRQIKDWEKKRKEKRSKLFEEQDAIEEQKDALIESIESRLKQKTTISELFKIKWRIQ